MAARTPVRPSTRTEPPLRALARLMVSASRWKLAAIGLLTVGAGAAAALAVLLLVPVLDAAGVAVSAGSRPTSRLFAAALDLLGHRPSLVGSLAALIVVTAVQATLNLWQVRLAVSATRDVAAQLRQRLFDAICHVKWARFAEYRSSDLLEGLTARTERVGWAARSLTSFGAALVAASVYVAIAFTVSVPMTLVSLTAGAVLGAALHRQRVRSTAVGEAQAAVSRALFASAVESLANMKTIRAHGATGRHSWRLRALAERERAISVRLTGVTGMTRLCLDVGAVVLLSIVAYLAIRGLSVPAGELLVLVFVFTRLMPQLASVQQAYQNLIIDLPAFARVQTTIAECEGSAEARDASSEAISFDREVRLAHVSFAYGEDLVVNDITMSIPAGRTVAVVGPSGAGKTTVADLVLGLITPQRGSISIDGTVLKAGHAVSWREQVSYVSQDGFLFHDTVRANLLWAAPSATEDELRQALKSAAAGFVMTLPQGLDTVVGDRGVLLSGGERQRLAVARALLRRPRLLVLDEPTSALDSENGRLLERALDELHGRMAVLLMTHRLSMVRRADTIYVLDGGRVVEHGSWDELLSVRNGRFQALCHAQGMEWEAADVR